MATIYAHKHWSLWSITLAAVLLVVMPISIFAQVSVEPNPPLSNSCGLDIALVLDESGSVSGNEQDIKDAANAFVNAFLPATPTLLGVVHFSSSASLEQDLTDNVSDLTSAINALSPSGLTNWEAALATARGMLEGGSDRDDTDHPDLIVMFSDGDPNVSTSGGNALDNAVAEANAAKTSGSSLPIRVIGVAIGSGPDIDNFKEITNGASSIVSPTDQPIGIDTDIVVSDFDQLATDLATLANALCEEPPQECDCGPVTVVNKNKGYVKNIVISRSSTGGNSADGSSGGDGGDGGDIESYNGGQDVKNSSTGSGGRGGSGGLGGFIQTGDALSTALSRTFMNINRVRVR